MSRIADAHARAGVRLPGEEEHRWNTEREAAERYLEIPKPTTESPKPVVQSLKPRAQEPNPEIPKLKVQIPNPKTEEARLELPDTGHETIDFELATAIRRIFLAPQSSLRSVLFCTMPGDRMSAVAWRAAEFLAVQSGQRVAFVSDGASERFAEDRHPLVTRIGWYEPSAAGGVTSHSQASDVLGDSVSDLQFPFVIVNATASTVEDLVPLACQVDGVIVIVTQNETRSAATLDAVETMRMAGVAMLGVILAND